MPYKPKGNIATPEQMQALAEGQRNSRLYSKENDAGEVVAALGARLAMEIENLPSKADLRDAGMIQTVAAAYVANCARAGTIPCKSGLCRCLGYSRQGVEYFLKHHENEDGAEKLRMIFDAFAELLNDAALTGACREVTAIFLAKAIYGYRDTVSIETELREDPYGYQHRTAEEIIKKYADLPLPD